MSLKYIQITTHERLIYEINKLKIDKKTTSAVLENKNTSGEKSNVYKMTKTLGVKYCTAIINSDDKNSTQEIRIKTTLNLLIVS